MRSRSWLATILLLVSHRTQHQRSVLKSLCGLAATGALIAACQDTTGPQSGSGVYGVSYSTTATDYAQIDLGHLGRYPSQAVGISDRLQVVGFSSTTAGPTHAFTWYGGTINDLGTLGGSSYALAVNRAGLVAGHSQSSVGTQSRAVIWENGKIEDLKIGYAESYATDVNQKGQVVGYGRLTVTDDYQSFIWKNGAIISLGTLGGNTIARAINDRGQAVGYSNTGPAGLGWIHAVIWEKGEIVDLGTLGVTASIATDINRHGQIVGWSYPAGSWARQAVTWVAGVITALPSLGGDSEATAINDDGVIVGSACLPSGERYAVVWENGVIELLSTENSWATAVNGRGDIAGYAGTPSRATLWQKTRSHGTP